MNNQLNAVNTVTVETINALTLSDLMFHVTDSQVANMFAAVATRFTVSDVRTVCKNFNVACAKSKKDTVRAFAAYVTNTRATAKL